MGIRILSEKKGILFTLVAIVLSVVVILSFSVHTGYRLKEKMYVIETRVNTMNNFITDIEDDLKKGVYISSFRAILSMSQYIATNGSFIEDINPAFEELFTEGTLFTEEADLMIDSTFTDWVERIQAESAKIDIISNITINKVEILQENPWYITVNANVNMIIEDNKETSSWSLNKDIKTNISIIGMEDPLYLINSQGRITNTIRQTIYNDFVSGSNVDNLIGHTNESYYISRNSSPSFLMRFQGNFSPSENGIESLVNVQEFIDQGISSNDKSIVDYIYFSNITSTDYRINNTPSWFKIDEDHLKVYEVEDLAY